MNGDFDRLTYSLSLLINGIYEPLCIYIPAYWAQVLLIMDVLIFTPYVVIGLLLVVVWRRFLVLGRMGVLMLLYGCFIVFCGATHVTGLALEMGGYLKLDVAANAITAFLSFPTAVLTVIWWPEIRATMSSLNAAVKQATQ